MDNTQLKMIHNRLDHASPFVQGLVLSNDYYSVRMSYTDYQNHKANGTLDPAALHIDATPYNDVCAPVLTGTGVGILWVFSKVMVSTENGLAELKDSITAAEDTIEQINKLVEEYFTN